MRGASRRAAARRAPAGGRRSERLAGRLDRPTMPRSRQTSTSARSRTNRRSGSRPAIRVKRVYEPAAPTDGLRVLVDRLWPRGMSRTAVAADLWLKDVAPSTALRRWFAHDPAKWDAFKRRYFAELDANRAALVPLIEAARRGPVTLLFSAADERHNQAVALREYLLAHARDLGRRVQA
jgi:uncharacterized protein YeaO (DUF488 family)